MNILMHNHNISGRKTCMICGRPVRVLYENLDDGKECEIAIVDYFLSKEDEDYWRYHECRKLNDRKEEENISHCPSEAVSLGEPNPTVVVEEHGEYLDNEEHLAGYEVSQGKIPEECPICYHEHIPIHLGGSHLD